MGGQADHAHDPNGVGRDHLLREEDIPVVKETYFCCDLIDKVTGNVDDIFNHEVQVDCL